METNDIRVESHVTNNNSNFDKIRARKNVLFSVFFKIILLAFSLVTRRLLINYLGNDLNGVNSLYTSIIGFLSVADLGIGTAIIYCMYGPIANGETSKVRQLYTLFKKVYFVIGAIVLFLGLIVLFFLPYLAKGYTDLSNLYISYIISLVAVVITYTYSAKMSLINAYKNNYISVCITSIGIIVQDIIIVFVLIFAKSFILFNLAKIVCSLTQLLLFALYNKNNDITKFPEKIEKELQNNVVKNVKAMFLHKIGDVIFSTVDSLVISSIIGVVVLGYYSNYVIIVTSMNELLKMFIIPLTSVIGHMGVKSSKIEKKRYFGLFYSINFFLGFMFYLGYYAVSNDIVTIIFGDGLLIERNLLLVLTITYYIQFLRQSASVFKDSFGLFYKDRWIALIAALLNAGLSILMAYFWGVYGVLIATIIVDIFIYHIFEPLILFKYGFACKPIKYYMVNYLFMALFSVTIICFSQIDISFNNHFIHLLVMGLISLLFDFLPLTIILCYKPFRVYACSKLKKILKK